MAIADTATERAAAEESAVRTTIIDADAHVVESEKTWSYMEGADRQYRPQTVILPDAKGQPAEYWAIDGRLMSKGPIAVDEVTRALREMEDIPARLKYLRNMPEVGPELAAKILEASAKAVYGL